ncbi:MAG: STAS domain-containing protein [Planctomycetes bacterium]|jgi:anti-anti-sigma factor|nr:STAS domain-containing protein [Planctomycetota bacterium]MCL4730059.1 STAS domain-containing protein [Planctomycetota bacterium]
MAQITVPRDFRGMVVTLPADMGATGTARLVTLADQADFEKFAGHRVLHLHQVERLDSSAVAALVELVQRVRQMGYEVALCEPPPVVRSYLEIYGAAALVDGSILSSRDDGTYESPLVPFVPPFVPEPRGRIDMYADGRVRSWLIGREELVETAPVNLAAHPPKVPARAGVMAVAAPQGLAEIRAGHYVWVRRHLCGCDAEHTIFSRVHRLHQWYRRKGFDFLALELWASDQPAGIITEKLAFRDRGHFGQFETLLKVDTSWREHAPEGEHEDEFYYLYA